MKPASGEPVRIRRFQDNDRAAVIELWKSAGLTRPWNDPDRDIDRNLNHGLALLVAEVTDTSGPASTQAPDTDTTTGDWGAIVGAVMVGYDGHRGWVNYLAVDPSHRQVGLGRALVARAEELLLGVGCPKLNLQIRGDNTDAQAFYRSLGFEPDAAISMGKRLISDRDRPDTD